jgi:hypothetical protein
MTVCARRKRDVTIVSASVILLDANLAHPKLLPIAKKRCAMPVNWRFARAFCVAASGSYPAKAIAKNSASLITYPHSDFKHFENGSRPSELV